MVAEDDAEFFNESPYIYVRSSGHAVGLTWQEANEYCSDTYGTQLATADSSTEWSQVEELLDMDSSYSNAWIGLNDIDNDGSWEWAAANYNDTPISLSWDNWGSGEPNGGTNENCVHARWDGKWNDLNCDTELWGFVCNYEYTAVENGRYIGVRIYTEQVNHETADQFCYDKFGTTLASIHNYRDNIRAAESIDSFNTFALFGLYNITSSSRFLWTDSTDYDLDTEQYNNWASGEPDMLFSGGDNDCGYFQPTVDVSNPEWWDWSCTSTVFSAFVCNRYPAYITHDDDNGFVAINSATFDLDWYDASEACQTHFGDLASINSATDQIYVSNVVDDYDSSIDHSNVWIGLNDRSVEGSYAWTDATGYSYSNWYSGQPNDYGGAQDCVELLTNNNDEWNDQACDYEVPTFVCNQQHTTYETGSYVGVVSFLDRFTWDEANSYCQDKYGTQLASIHSSSDSVEIATIIDELNIYYAWIGLKDNDGDNVYTDESWIDGSSLSYTNWMSNRPNSASQQCVEAWLYYDGKWNDESCTYESSGFICNLPVEISETTNYIGVKWNYGNIKWDEASDYCATNFFTTLASIHSNSELQEIIGIFDIFGGYSGWIGMYYNENNNGWEWEDNTNVDFTDWYYYFDLNNQYYDDYFCVIGYEGSSGEGFLNVPCLSSLTHFVCNKLTLNDDINDDVTDDWNDYTTLSRTANPESNSGDGNDEDIALDNEYETGVIFDFDNGLSDFGQGAGDDDSTGKNSSNDTSYVVWIVGVLAVLFVMGLIVGSVIWYRRKKGEQTNVKYIATPDMEMVEKESKKEAKVGYTPPTNVEYSEPSADEMMDSEPQKIY